MEKMTFISPTGHLGFTPIEKGSFYDGMKKRPDYVIADSGSCDIGPHPLGSNEHASPEEWQRHDLEVMLLESRRSGSPMIVGSASDTGADKGVDQYVEIIKELAEIHRLPRFTLGYIYSEVSKDTLRKKIESGIEVKGLGHRPNLTLELLDRTNHIVALMGVEPIIKSLDLDADVIIAGRSSDSCIFAAPAIRAGFPKATAYYMGKVLECASFAAEPFMGKESIIGTITRDEVYVTPMHPDQRCTVASIASHAMYERRDPFYEQVAGGYLDMTKCKYEQVDEKTVRITGFLFHDDPVYKVKLEGAGKVGERALSIAGIRDPYTIKHMDMVIGWARGKVRERWGETGDTYQLYYHIYGRDGVMGPWEPEKEDLPREICIVVEAIADKFEDAESICALGTRNLFYARLPEVRGTAGTAALMMDEVLRGKDGYEWTINHLLPLDDPLDIFTVKIEEVGV
jgi:hypothetical protein